MLARHESELRELISNAPQSKTKKKIKTGYIWDSFSILKNRTKQNNIIINYINVGDGT